MNKVSPIFTFLLLAILALSSGCARKPDDVKISSDIQSRFSQDSGLSSKQLTVQASNGVVTLAGFVDDDAQRQAAARQAAAVTGVKEVINNLQVGSASNAAAAAAAPLVQEAQPSHSPEPVKKTRRYRAPQNVAMNDGGPAPSDPAINSNPPAPEPNPPAPVAANTPPPAPAPPPLQKVTIEQGAQVSIRLIDSIDSEKNQVGDTFHASLNAPLWAEGAVAIPAGTDVTGHIFDLKSAGKFKGQSAVVLQLDKVKVNGMTYDLPTDQYRKEGASRGKNTAEKVGGGAVLGGIIGAIAGGGKGAAIGSAAGAGVGGGVQAASKSQQIKLPSETVLNFTLQAPVTVTRSQDPDAGRNKLGDSH